MKGNDTYLARQFSLLFSALLGLFFMQQPALAQVTPLRHPMKYLEGKVDATDEFRSTLLSLQLIQPDSILATTVSFREPLSIDEAQKILIGVDSLGIEYLQYTWKDHTAIYVLDPQLSVRENIRRIEDEHERFLEGMMRDWRGYVANTNSQDPLFESLVQDLREFEEQDRFLQRNGIVVTKALVRGKPRNLITALGNDKIQVIQRESAPSVLEKNDVIAPRKTALTSDPTLPITYVPVAGKLKQVDGDYVRSEFFWDYINGFTDPYDPDIVTTYEHDIQVTPTDYWRKTLFASVFTDLPGDYVDTRFLDDDPELYTIGSARAEEIESFR